MTTRTDRIQTAIAHLSAIELADGDYAYLADETQSWYRVSPSDLENLGDVLAEDPDATYDSVSEWADMSGDPMLPPGFKVTGADRYEDEDAPGDDTYSIAVTVQTTHGWVFVEVGVPDSLRGTADAAGTFHGLERVWPCGDGWYELSECGDVDAGDIISAVSDAALKVWHQS